MEELRTAGTVLLSSVSSVCQSPNSFSHILIPLHPSHTQSTKNLPLRECITLAVHLVNLHLKEHEVLPNKCNRD